MTYVEGGNYGWEILKPCSWMCRLELKMAAGEGPLCDKLGRWQHHLSSCNLSMTEHGRENMRVQEQKLNPIGMTKCAGLNWRWQQGKDPCVINWAGGSTTLAVAIWAWLNMVEKIWRYKNRNWTLLAWLRMFLFYLLLLTEHSHTIWTPSFREGGTQGGGVKHCQL